MQTDLPLIVDSFAGGGGASTGIEMALGRSPDIAINHSADALAMHAVNHPETLHLDSNIWDVSPREVTHGRHVGLFWASPDCKHFSKAKGGKPLDRNIRDLAWVVVRWAEEVKPDVIILENVEEFRTWGPLYEDGKPIVELRGQTFEDWTRRLKKAGYKVQWRELRACDYGAPTIRKRFFMIARRDGRPIIWPKRTHGDPKKPEDAKLIERGLLQPWRTAAEIIDWSLPCPSIFDTAAEIMEKFGVRAVRPLADATMRRIARGVVRYVLEAKRPFIVNLTHGVRLEDIARPANVMTSAHRGEKAIVVPSFIGCGGRAGQSAPRGGDEPTGTMTAKADGCVVSTFLTAGQHGGSNRSTDAPTHVFTASPKDTNGIAAVHLSRFTQNGIGSAADEPTDTVMAGAPRFGVVAAFLAQHNNDTKPNGVDFPRAGRSAGEPLSTSTTSAQQSIVAAFMAQHNSGNDGHEMGKPVSTLTGGGQGGVSQQGVVAAHIMRQFGTSTGHGMDEPTHTDTAAVNKSALIAPFLQSYYGTGDGQMVDGPMRTDTTKDRFGLVTVDIDGLTYAISDIGMRMLTPRERFRAQGFPDSYIIDRRPDGSPISMTVQGSCCGNSVCPPLAEALVAANCNHMAVQREAAQ